MSLWGIIGLIFFIGIFWEIFVSDGMAEVAYQQQAQNLRLERQAVPTPIYDHPRERCLADRSFDLAKELLLAGEILDGYEAETHPRVRALGLRSGGSWRYHISEACRELEAEGYLVRREQMDRRVTVFVEPMDLTDETEEMN